MCGEMMVGENSEARLPRARPPDSAADRVCDPGQQRSPSRASGYSAVRRVSLVLRIP